MQIRPWSDPENRPTRSPLRDQVNGYDRILGSYRPMRHWTRSSLTTASWCRCGWSTCTWSRSTRGISATPTFSASRSTARPAN